MPTTLSVTEGIDLSGKTALVTGASSGIGKECARVLAFRGARVLLACRNQSKTEVVLKEYAGTIGHEAASRCEFWSCDTSSMQSVRALTARIIGERLKIDFLFLNAGVFGRRFELTDEGLETTYAANYLGHFLLVHELLSGKGLTPNARIVATLTNGIYQNPFSKADLEMLSDPQEENFSRGNASPNSKVLLALMMREFANRVKATPLSGVTFTGGDPGATLTDNINQVGKVLGAVSRLLQPILFKPVEEGAAVLLWAATHPVLSGVSGKLYSHKLKEIRLPHKCTDPALSSRAWNATEQILGLTHS